MIRITDLTVRYPEAARDAVERLDLVVPAGVLFGLVGPNGAGKTTTLKVLAGLVAPTSGSVRVAGADVAGDPASVRRRVGYLPDFFGVYDDLTCREYLDFFAAAQGLGRDRREPVVEEVLELVDLVAKADVLAGSLSRGMQQRLGLARVLVHDPAVLLLDEPASGLDPRARVEVREILVELGRMGRTVVLSSHVLADLAAACDAVAIMEQGRLVGSGSVRELCSRAAAEQSVVRVACAEGPEAARRALAGTADLRAARSEIVDGMLLVHLEHDAAVLEGSVRSVERLEADRSAAAAAVGRSLFEAGLSVTHLEVERANLERAFMALTEGRLA